MAETVGIERVRVPKTAEVVARALRTQIVRGDIAEGAPLPSEAALMEQFGVSRPSLREAFRILESERLIVVRRGARGGARATRPDLAVAARYLGLIMEFDRVELSDVFVARAMIEPLGLRLLAGRDDRAKAVEATRAIVARLAEVTGAKEYAALWMELFQTIFDACGNRSLGLLYGALTDVVARELEDALVVSSPAATGRPRDPLDAFVRALDLVDEGKGAEAQAYWTDQMMSVSDLVHESHRGRTLVEVTGEY
ncbi:GntR family transcriptional regulator [Nocardioides sp. YIM 152588]|uniref:FadR/GntR family transcriptional regulator n=1 Tax=Nocardioides sp. YIM 152588 TaxID=3158259 RepID=UPI0032E43706